MTRVYLPGLGYLLRIPDSWTVWTLDGVRYERVDGTIWERRGGKWREALVGERASESIDASIGSAEGSTAYLDEDMATMIGSRHLG